MSCSMKGRLINIGDVELNVFTEGSGQPILVPTGCGTEYYRQTFSEKLQDQFQLVYIEMRGTGYSTGSALGATFASLADDINAVREALGIQQAVLMGHSNHGSIVLEYALNHPKHTAAVISVASTPDFIRIFPLGGTAWETRATDTQKTIQAKLQADFDALDLQKLDADETALQGFMTLTPLAWMDPTTDVKHIFGGTPKGIADYLEVEDHAQKHWHFVPHLSKISAPVLVLSGQHDFFCPTKIWQEAIGQLPHGELEIFENSAHNPQYEESEKFDAAVTLFLSTL